MYTSTGSVCVIAPTNFLLPCSGFVVVLISTTAAKVGLWFGPIFPPELQSIVVYTQLLL